MSAGVFELPPGLFGRQPQPRDYMNSDEEFEMNDINFEYLESLWSCGTPSEEDEQVLVFIRGLRMAGSIRLSSGHPVSGLIHREGGDEVMGKTVTGLIDYGIIRAKAIDGYDECYGALEAARAALDVRVMERVRKEQALGDPNLPQAG